VLLKGTPLAGGHGPGDAGETLQTSGLPHIESKKYSKIGFIRQLFARIVFDRANDANCSHKLFVRTFAFA